MMEIKPKITRKKKSKGLGDTIAKVTKATGIEKVAKFVLGEDCNCDERQEKLNKMFPYAVQRCLTEEEYDYLTLLFKDIAIMGRLRPTQKTQVLTMYNSILGKNHSGGCGTCWGDIFIPALKKIYNEY
jgi:hypothetical protein